MKTLITISRDEEGMLRAVGTGRNRLVATFFETDIQEDEEIARELLTEVQALRAGSKTRFEISGNGHSLVLTGKTATIESLFDDSAPARRLKLEQFHELLRRWLTALDGD